MRRAEHEHLRVLFVLAYPGYLRYYDSTIKRLAARGHEVRLVFEQPTKQSEGLKALDGADDDRISIRPTFPRRSAIWDGFPREVRRTADWVRYLDPRFVEATYLRQRSADLMATPLRRLSGVQTVSARNSRRLMRAMTLLEQAIPSYPSVEELIDEEHPDVLVVTPLVTSSSRQPDVVKAAHRRGIPTVAGIASWDHLSSKGLIRTPTDCVVVWNEVQAREAIEFHDVPRDRITVTGAQPWDRWFEREPSTTPTQFRDKVGLPDDRPYVLFVGSTASISAPTAELEFVREWVDALRRSDLPAVRDAAILVRPHPYNPGQWTDADMSTFGDHVAVYPRAGANPVDDDDRAVYFDSMYHAEAVVGINTSAMMEAGIVGRPVFTVRSPRFTDSQGGTVHFSYLLADNGGFVHVAGSFEEHIMQLERALTDPGATRAEIATFVERFVRPHGRAREATALVADAIERTGREEPAARRGMPPALYPLRGALWLAGAAWLMFDENAVGKLMVRAAQPTHRAMCRAGTVVEAATGRLGPHAERAGGQSVRHFVVHGGMSVRRRLDDGGARIERSLKFRGKRLVGKAKAKSVARKEAIRRSRQKSDVARAEHSAAQVTPLRGEQEPPLVSTAPS